MARSGTLLRRWRLRSAGFSSAASAAPPGLGYRAPNNAHGYCLQLLRAYDHENYLINLVLPGSLRRAHAAFRAFNVELVRIRDAVTHEDHGRIRVAWYRTALESALFQEPSKAPVIQAVTEVLTEPSSSERNRSDAHRALLGLLDAREEDLAYRKFATVKDLEHFADQTQGSILRATVSATRKEDESDPDILLTAATAFGKAYGLAVMLRGIPYNARSRISYVPEELVETYNSAYSHLIKDEPTEETRQITRHLVESARRNVEEGRRLATEIRKKDKTLFSCRFVVDKHLKKLQVSRFNPFHSTVQAANPLALQATLFLARVFDRR